MTELKRKHSWIKEAYDTNATLLKLQARPLFKDRRKFHQMADPVLEGKYPSRGLYQVLAIAAMCTEREPGLRPEITDIVKALTYLSSQIYDPAGNNLTAENGIEQIASRPNSGG